MDIETIVTKFNYSKRKYFAFTYISKIHLSIQRYDMVKGGKAKRWRKNVEDRVIGPTHPVNVIAVCEQSLNLTVKIWAERETYKSKAALPYKCPPYK